MAEFVRQRAVAGGQPVLDEEDVAVGVLAPLAADSRRQVGHRQLDRPAPTLGDGGDQAGQRHFAPAWGKVEDLTDGTCDATAGWHSNPLSMCPLSRVPPS
ncbi:hypothetical protein MMAD_52090 [Mycolicibacterium madagascariense]|uniref:Uncharacterized protein n=1 Tax=Mycolicibacterium madagascariense TaxID=212765 RepID=A0A7I7XP62_9MYCO|nr:hypothetical protein MMAD_52090 [Mycolicibacterium madagascariense]